MFWEHLATKPFDIRFQLAAGILKGKTKNKIIVDINSGEPKLYGYLEQDFTGYYANDISPINTKGDKLYFNCIKDEEVDIRPDILVLFGYGGGEFTGQSLESKKAGETVIRLSRYHPEYIVIEMVQKLEDDFKALTKIESKLAIYNLWIKSSIKIGNGSHYHDNRLMAVYRGVWLTGDDI